MDKALVEQKLKAITEKIVKEYQPEKIILFGSWAWGEPHEWSDIDLLIVKRTDTPRLTRERELGALLYPRMFPIDVLVYTPEELATGINERHNLFLEDIVRNGQVLYTRPGSEAAINIPRRPLTILQ